LAKERLVVIEIDRRLCVGMLLVGALGYYDNKEIAQDKSLEYIASKLRKRNFTIKNGSAKDRFNRNSKALMRSKAIFDIHAHIADDAWNAACMKFGATNEISVSALIYFLIKKNPDVQKFYEFNPKELEKFYKSNINKSTHSFSSMRTASKIMEMLDIHVAYYNFNVKKLQNNTQNSKI
jgi:hypothetical protein